MEFTCESLVVCPATRQQPMKGHHRLSPIHLQEEPSFAVDSIFLQIGLRRLFCLRHPSPHTNLESQPKPLLVSDNHHLEQNSPQPPLPKTIYRTKTSPQPSTVTLNRRDSGTLVPAKQRYHPSTRPHQQPANPTSTCQDVFLHPRVPPLRQLRPAPLDLVDPLPNVRPQAQGALPILQETRHPPLLRAGRRVQWLRASHV